MWAKKFEASKLVTGVQPTKSLMPEQVTEKAPAVEGMGPAGWQLKRR
jgi:hypothetical protein